MQQWGPLCSSVRAGEQWGVVQHCGGWCSGAAVGGCTTDCCSEVCCSTGYSTGQQHAAVGVAMQRQLGLLCCSSWGCCCAAAVGATMLLLPLRCSMLQHAAAVGAAKLQQWGLH